MLKTFKPTKGITPRTLAAQAREDFMHVASHELRGPVANFRLSVQLLERELARGERGRVEERLRVLSRQADRLGRLSGALLDVTRITAGRLTLLRQDLDLAALAREVVARHEDQAQAAGAEVSVEAEGPVPCQADPDRVEQVIANLVSNALKYAPRGEIRISGSLVPSQVIVCVSDQGPGIDPRDLPHIFDRFYRSDAAVKQTKGAGLGLYLARAIIEAHGGHIWADPKPDSGARICFSLPR